jgi:hypothetical protein
MAVATITLDSSNGDWVVVSAPNDEYLADEIILDTDPKGMYATGFTVRTISGAFETGGRIVGEQVPIREMVLPFWLTPASRMRFQRLWGTPGNFQKVTYTYDGPSGPRSLVLKLSKEIEYTTQDGFDADIDAEYHAVVSAIAINPMYEAAEDVAEFVNPDDRFTVVIVGTGGTFPLTFTPTVGSPATATGIAYNAAPSAVQSAIEALAPVGAGKVTVTGTAGNYLVVFAVGTNGVLSSTGSGVTGTGHAVNIDYAPNTGWFDVWNPTDQPLRPEWTFDPAEQWKFPDFAFGQELKWGRTVGEDAARLIVTVPVTSQLSVMSDPFMDTYMCADLSNFAGLMNGVEPMYAVPPYTGTEDVPVLEPVICFGPAGATATLRQRRFWSAEAGLEMP